MEEYRFQNRRSFLKYVLGAGAALYAGDAGAINALLEEKGFERLSILYTNDQHSRIEPFPDNDPKFAGEGGFAKRAALIGSLRKTERNLLLLDAGDVFQGTPYFNYFSGELEYKLMSMMGYDASTFGNHDFDLGCENIFNQMPHAKFSFINANYDLGDTVLSAHKNIFPYRVFKKGKIKIGVTGVGIQLENLVDKRLIKGIKYSDPVAAANKYAQILREDEKCDYVICLSHLGFAYENKKVSDKILAAESRNIDLIIGGHTHTFLNTPEEILNLDNKKVFVTQMGWAGIWVGRIDLIFSLYNKKFLQSNSAHKI